MPEGSKRNKYVKNAKLYSNKKWTKIAYVGCVSLSAKQNQNRLLAFLCPTKENETT